MKKLLIGLMAMATSMSVFGYGFGVSTHPLVEDQKAVTAEFNGIFARGKGMGMQARYTQKISPLLTVDGGFGFTDGSRANNIFVNADYELYPDYMRQPRISVRGTLQRADEYGDTVNRIGIAPVVSKGFNFWGKEAFPFISIPVSLDLNGDESSYQVGSRLAFGMTGNLPIRGYENLLANFETNLDINNGFSSVFMGLSLPLN